MCLISRGRVSGCRIFSCKACEGFLLICSAAFWVVRYAIEQHITSRLIWDYNVNEASLGQILLAAPLSFRFLIEKINLISVALVFQGFLRCVTLYS